MFHILFLLGQTIVSDRMPDGAKCFMRDDIVRDC